MKKQIEKFRQYLDYIEEHYDNVQKAWAVLQDKCADMRFITDDFYFETININVINHDLSKLSEQEFTQYRQYFFPVVGALVDNEKMNEAWENHKKENFHHWQTWTTTKFPEGSPYPEIYFIENIIDWMAMGYKFNDTAKAYYEKNKENIKLPDWAVKRMYEIFEMVY